MITVLIGFIPTGVPSPDVVLIVVVLFGFRNTLPLGGVFSFSLGLLQDVLAGGIIGLNAFSKTVVFALTRSITRRFYIPNVASKIAMVLLGGIVDNLLMATILLIVGGIHIVLSHFFYYLLLQISCTGLLSPVILAMTPKIARLEERGEGSVFTYGHPKARTRGI